MNHKQLQLAARRERLVAQAAAQRALVAQSIDPWRLPLALADQGLASVRFLRKHPAWVVGGGLLLATLRPRWIGKWAGRGWLTWQLTQRLLGK